jgi:demethylspheroidene O-methyltransferase
VAWSDRYLAVRDRWLSSPKFQRWAAAFPLTRPTARKRARALFDVCAGFVYSQILFACVRLKLFDLLADGPLSAADIAARLQVPLDSTERLLEAATSLRLVEKRHAARFGLGSLGAAMVGNPAVSAMVEHNRLLYADLHDPVSLLRGEQDQTELGKYWTYTAKEAPGLARDSQPTDYTALMANSQPLVSDEILDAYPLNKHVCLLDVGGGDGSFLIEAGKRHPNLQLKLFDLPPVAKRAAQRFAALDLQGRAEAVGGSFLNDRLPEGADVISLVRVVHDHDDAAAMQLLRAVYQALPPKGVLLLAEPMMGTPGAEPVGDAYFGFYLLAMGRGRPRAPQELQRMLEGAGFAHSQLLRTRQPLQSRLIIARKADATVSVNIN